LFLCLKRAEKHVGGKKAQKGFQGPMKAVAVALVLIAGAAVVLWYGNTANSWVVGGLVGGLAALLLSIPISLSLFSYLSRRHDERMRGEDALIEEEISLSQIDDDPRLARRAGKRSPQYIESSVYELEDEFEIDDERHEREGERVRRHQPTSRKRLPAGKQPPEHRRAPIIEQGSSLARDLPRLPAPGAQTKDLREQTSDPDKTLPRRGQYPGLPGSDTAAFRSKYQSRALHTARLEAAGQREEGGQRSTQSLRKYPPGGAKNTRSKFQGQVVQPGNEGGKSTIDDFADEKEQSSRQRRQRETDIFAHRSLDTGPIMSPDESPHQGARRPQIEQEYMNVNAEEDANAVHRTRPLIRRAPYLYEDDLLRQELYQHIEAPQVRRSSRKDSTHQSEEEE
jgi:hypothetical protein